MSYTILNTDGTTLTLIADGTVDQSATSLDLVGRNVNFYGQYLNNNLVKLLGNFANTANSPPRSPLTGQLWYDTTAKKVKVYDNGFKTISGAIVSAAQPSSLATGDIWWDTTNNQLRIFNDNTTFVIGPAFSKTIGDNGWALPNVTINSYSTDPLQNNIPQQVTLLKNYGQFIGAVSNETFTLSSADSTIYFNTTTNQNMVAGLTIKGNIKYTGQLNNNYLSTDVNFQVISASTSTITAFLEYQYQNTAIRPILQNMFPPIANESTNEIGVPIGSECRVLCQFQLPGTNGLQIRRFKIVDDPSAGIGWQPYEAYSYAFETTGGGDPTPVTALSNVVYEVRY